MKEQRIRPAGTSGAWWVFVSFVVVVLVACLPAIWIVMTQRAMIDYIERDVALYQVADLISMFARKEWRPPNGWDDMREVYDATQAGYNTWTFEELRVLVSIDFERLKHPECDERDGYPFDAVRSSKLRGREMESIEKEVNHIVRRALCRTGKLPEWMDGDSAPGALER